MCRDDLNRETPLRRTPVSDGTASPQPAFQPAMSGNDDGPGSGAPWHQPFVKASLHRIRSSATVEAASVQATTEVVVLLHSIRRILIWTAVIIPAALLAVVLFFLAIY